MASGKFGYGCLVTTPTKFPGGPHLLPNEGKTSSRRLDYKPARTQTPTQSKRRRTSDNFGPVVPLEDSSGFIGACGIYTLDVVRNTENVTCLRCRGTALFWKLHASTISIRDQGETMEFELDAGQIRISISNCETNWFRRSRPHYAMPFPAPHMQTYTSMTQGRTPRIFTRG
jgi:hypothetical protein